MRSLMWRRSASRSWRSLALSSLYSSLDMEALSSLRRLRASAGVSGPWYGPRRTPAWRSCSLRFGVGRPFGGVKALLAGCLSWASGVASADAAAVLAAAEVDVLFLRDFFTPLRLEQNQGAIKRME